MASNPDTTNPSRNSMSPDDTSPAPSAPLQAVTGKSSESNIEPGAALCLSGGGYRAMVFHLGALIRLNEVGLLSQLKRVSSASGGSITAGVLGTQFSGNLGFSMPLDQERALVEPYFTLPS